MPFRKQQHPRKPIRAQTINYGVEARNILDNITVAPPLEIQTSGQGINIRLASALHGNYPAVTTTTVAGGSYGSPVSATVTLLSYNGTGLVSSGRNVTALNGYANTTAIGSGKLVWLTVYSGKWWIVDADCS